MEGEIDIEVEGEIEIKGWRAYVAEGERLEVERV